MTSSAMLVARLHRDARALALERLRAGQDADRHPQEVESVAWHLALVVSGVDPPELLQVLQVPALLVEDDGRFEADAIRRVRRSGCDSIIQMHRSEGIGSLIRDRPQRCRGGQGDE